MKQASILIKPASSNCNMDCKYCFYKCMSSNREQYSLGFMPDEVLENLVRKAIQYTDDYLTFAFQGGEPMLAGIDFFKRVIELQKQFGSLKPGLRIDNTIQTNGTLLNEEWCEFFHRENFLVGVSLDGPRKNHDAWRVMADGKESFGRVMNGVELLKKYNVDFNILTVVTEQLAGKASALYKFYKRNNFGYVQLIPCMDEEDRQAGLMNSGKVDSAYAVKPESYGHFLNKFFDMWYEDFKRGDIMDVRMFSNLAQMTIGYPPEECGMCGQCDAYFVVEGDGSIYPCDFYCMDEYKLGNVKDICSFEEVKKCKKVTEFESNSMIKPEKCTECEYYSLCRGGCRRFREMNTDDAGVNYLCEGYKIFYAHTKDRLEKLGRTIVDPLARMLL